MAGIGRLELKPGVGPHIHCFGNDQLPDVQECLSGGSTMVFGDWMATLEHVVVILEINDLER